MKKFLGLLIATFFSLTHPTFVSADVLGRIQFPAELTGVDAGSFLNRIIGLVIAISGIVFFFLLLWGGLRYMLAGGDPKNTESARKILTSALIGLLIVVGAYFITILLGRVLGYTNILNPTIPGL